jgi:hypothetical protein
MEAVLPLCAEQGITIISNMGAANPIAAASKTRDIATRLGISGLRTAAVTGDDVLPIVQGGSLWSNQSGGQEAQAIVSANAYLGAEPILEALASGANVILTGRVADPSLFLAPLVHEFGWSMEDWDLLGQGTVIGHLLECAGQLTGGYFADPPFKIVPKLAQLGFPIAEVSEDGTAVVTKVDGSGGMVTPATCKEQLLYEIQDPSSYLTPDVVANFSDVSVKEIARDRVHISGGRGCARPTTLKVSVGYQAGYIGEAQISYAGPGALARAELAKEILIERFSGREFSELRFDFIGVNAIHGTGLSRRDCEPYEVRLRVAAKASTLKLASMVHREVEALYTNGPAGGGGVTGSAKETIAVFSEFVPRDHVPYQIRYEVS